MEDIIINPSKNDITAELPKQMRSININKSQLKHEPSVKDFLRSLKNPVQQPTPQDPIFNAKIIKINTPNVSDNVEYGFLNTITYQRGMANNAMAPISELKGYIIEDVARKIRPSDGGAPPSLKSGSIGKRIV